MEETKEKEESAIEETKSAKDDDCKKDINWWMRFIKNAKKRASLSWARADEAWAEYDNNDPIIAEINNVSQNQAYYRCYPIYWSSCKTLEPALFSRVPDVTTERTFGVSDDVALTAEIIVDRLGDYAKRISSFSSTLEKSVQDYIHADKTTTQVVYRARVVESDEVETVPLIEVVQGQYQTQEGEVWTEEVKTEDGVTFFGVKKSQDVDDQEVHLCPVVYDEIIHTPEAKTNEEIKEMGYFFCFSEEEAEAIFSREQLQGVQWLKTKEEAQKYNDKDQNKYTNNSNDSRSNSEGTPGKYMSGWECWCKETRKIYTVCEQKTDAFIAVRDDTYGLRNFFPSPPFQIGSKPKKSLYPTPRYWQVRSTVRELHSMYAKVMDLIDAVRRRALVDGSNPDLVESLNTLDQSQFIAVTNLAAILEKGGLNNLIQYLPVQELVQAITELVQLDQTFRTNFNEWFGIPDVLRGNADPLETLGSQQIQTQAAHDRFKLDKQRIQALARDSLEMMVDLMLKVYKPEKIARIVGYDYLDDARKATFLPALQLLQNDEERLIRIDIETDSTSFIDQNIKREKMKNVATTVLESLKTISDIVRENPQAQQMSIAVYKVLLGVLDGSDVGKKYLDSVKSAVNEMIDATQNPPPAPPPPPDYEQMKIQLQMQRQQGEFMAKQRDLDIREFQVQSQAQNEQFKNELDSYKQQQAVVMNQFIQWAETQGLNIEMFKAQQQADESMREEDRLAFEAQVNAMNPPQPEQVKEPQPSTIIINAPQGGQAIPQEVPVPVPVPVNPLQGLL